MYQSYSMELAGRTLTVDIGTVWVHRQMDVHSCTTVIPLYYLLQQHLKSQETESTFSLLA